MIEAENDNMDTATENAEMCKEEEIALLKHQKEQMEKDFNVKRAKFKELFLRKEDELKKEKTELCNAINKIKELENRVKHLEADLNDAKSELFIMKCENDQELQNQECVTSLHGCLEDQEDIIASLENEVGFLKKQNEQMQSEIQELKHYQSDSASVNPLISLSTITRNITKKVGSLTSVGAQVPIISKEIIPDDLENNIWSDHKYAQEGAEMLRSLVVSLEEEVAALKDKLREAYDKVRVYENVQINTIKSSEALGDLLKGKPLSDVVNELDEKLKELSNDLKVEKSSRTDLEMYAAILNTQKTALQENTDCLKSQLQEVCRSLEEEKRRYGDLKKTWQMANDQFLESQRMQMKEMSRIQKVLTEEQLCKISEMKKDDEQLNFSFENLKSYENHKLNKFSSNSFLLQKFLPVMKESVVMKSQYKNASYLPKSHSLESIIHGISSKNSDVYFVQSLDVSSTFSQQSPERFSCLTEDQHKALVEEYEERKKIINYAKNYTDELETHNRNGKRLVSNEEWLALLNELKNAYLYMNKSCKNCESYQLDLKKQEKELNELSNTNVLFEKALNRYKEELDQKSQQFVEMEQNWILLIKEYESTIENLHKKDTYIEDSFLQIKQACNQIEKNLSLDITQLSINLQQIENLLNNVKHENKYLHLIKGNKALAHCDTMDQIPNNIDSLQIMIIKLQEELHYCQATRKMEEETLRNENLLLKDKLKSEQYQKECLEAAYVAELDSLRSQLKLIEANSSERLKTSHEFSNTNNSLIANTSEVNIENHIKYEKSCEVADSIKNIYTNNSQFQAQSLISSETPYPEMNL